MMEAEDRISDVPDLIVHGIFSFLEMKDVVQTTFLSKKWRYLWKSCPYLNFTPRQFKSRHEYTKFLLQVFHLRGDDFKIHRLSFVCHDPLFLYKDLVWALTNDHLQELSLALLIEEPIVLPDQLFTCALRSLTLFGYKLSFTVRVPVSMTSSASITSLDLTSIKLPLGNNEGELILSCSVLEELRLCDCDHSHLKLLTISAVQLKRLELLCACNGIIGLCALKICGSTNTKSIKLVGYMYTDYCLEKLTALTSTYIGTFRDRDMKEEVFAEGMIKVFNGINNVKSLTLSASVLEVCFYGKGKVERASLLDGSAFSCLETIEIQNIWCARDELKFLEFLLKKALHLETMIITSVTPDRMKLGEFRCKLLALPRASSRVSIRFK